MKPKHAAYIKVKRFTVSDCFQKQAVWQFVFFFKLRCIWNRICIFKPQKLLQDEGRRTGLLPSSCQPLSWLSSPFSAQAGQWHRSKVRQRLVSWQDISHHHHGMHTDPLAPLHVPPQVEVPLSYILLRPLVVERKVFCTVSFHMKNLYPQL